MRKKIAIITVSALMISLAGCGQKESSQTGSSQTNTETTVQVQVDSETKDEPKIPSSPLRYSLGTSSSGGNFYLVGGGIATILNNALPEYFVITAEETGGSTANLTMIQNGDAEIGIAMTSSLAEAAEGKAEWTGRAPMDKVRGMVALYPSYMTMYALSSNSINSISDFNGKIVGLGSKGAAMDSVLREAFVNMEIAPSSIFNDGHGATATAVSDGQVDAAILFSFPPFSAITELEASKELTFIGLTDEEQKKLCDTYPFYSPAVLSSGAYKGIKEDLKTVSEWNMLVVSSEVPEDYVYLLTKNLIEQNPALIEVHKSLEYATAENILNYNIWLHTGTIKYLEEIGISVPDRLIPPEYTK